MTKRIDIANLPLITGTLYPPPYDEPCRARQRRRLGDAAGLSQFGVNLLRLPPGAWSSQRHWHAQQDEFAYVVAGEVVLVSNDGEEIFKAGDCVGFKCGEQNGHHFQNRSDSDALLLEIGTRNAVDTCSYSDIDLHLPAGSDYTHKDGTPYPPRGRR